MITADTITDSQIRALGRESLTAGQHKDVRISLLAFREGITSIVAKRLAYAYPTRKERKAARARLAEILNARAEGKS